MSVSERLNFLIKKLKLTINSFSNEIGVSQSSVRSIAEGVNQPSAKVLIPIITKFPNVNLNWLLLGYGEMFLEETQTTDEKIKHRDTVIKILEQSVYDLRKTVELLEKTNEEQRKEIERLRKKEKTA